MECNYKLDNFSEYVSVNYHNLDNYLEYHCVNFNIDLSVYYHNLVNKSNHYDQLDHFVQY